ncbi:MAG: peptidylprolyl isomerase [Planctomycetota bacterium]
MSASRLAMAMLLTLGVGCASTSESPAQEAASPSPQQQAAVIKSAPRGASSKGRVLRTKESVLAPEDTNARMRSEAPVTAASDMPSEAPSTPPETVTPSTPPSPPPIQPVTSSMLVPLRALCRPNAPIELDVRAPVEHGPLVIHVMDRAGTTMDQLAVTAGVVDLSPLMKELERADRARWLQLRESGQPGGAPCWFVPLRAAPPVRTVRSIRASTQQPYLRVVGWGDRAYDPTDAETAAVMPTWTAPDPIVTSGFRLEPAVDVILHTDAGPLRVALVPDAAPATVENFLRLAREGFFDGTIFHRVVPLDREGRPFVIQGGDPTGTGDGGPGWNLALEPSDLPHDRGVLGMARGDDPHSAGSQFYVSLSREGTARLDGQYCTFAVLMDGWDTLDAIAAGTIGDATTGRPAVPVRIERVEIVPAPPRGESPLWPGPPKPEIVSPSPTPQR